MFDIKTRYDIVATSQFKKNLKKCVKQGKKLDKIYNVITNLANGIPLEMKYKDHYIIDDKYYKNCKECHIEPDWLLIYKYDNEKLILILVSTGSHSELF